MSYPKFIADAQITFRCEQCGKEATTSELNGELIKIPEDWMISSFLLEDRTATEWKVLCSVECALKQVSDKFASVDGECEARIRKALR